MINDLVNTGLQPAATTKSSLSPVKPAEPPVVPVAAEPESAPPESQAVTPGSDELSQAVSKLNDYVQNIKRTLSFSIAESTGRTIIQVYDSETDELIRQIPPEQTIQLAEKLDDIAASGFFVKERA
jgi:flagellar protein FlaG